ncbi:peptidylprolyl isomerase [Pedobacter sp. P351]|uniref:peptidylprolyl isomerase n=1 Tax=Pedobacter superstes TaxID=3133441 RepID=UPI00309A4AB1
MMKHTHKILFLVLFLSASLTYAAKPKTYYVRIKSTYGESLIRLYNETPKHRDNFVKLVKSGFYNGTLYHRVIKDFMIQGGDPDSKKAKPGEMLGNGSLPYTIPAEFNLELYHKKGALAAARDENPQKASSSTQFYLVQGKAYTDDELNRIEEMRLQGKKIPASHRQVYKSLGGTPHLDQSYTVFGEIVKGIEQVDLVASLKTDAVSRPFEDVRIKMTLLKKKEIKKLEKELLTTSFKNKLIMSSK